MSSTEATVFITITETTKEGHISDCVYQQSHLGTLGLKGFDPALYLEHSTHGCGFDRNGNVIRCLEKGLNKATFYT